MLDKNMKDEVGYDADDESADAASAQCDSDDGPSDDEDSNDGDVITEHNLVLEDHYEEIFDEGEGSDAVLDMDGDSKPGNVSSHQHDTASDKIEDDEHSFDEVYDGALDPRRNRLDFLECTGTDQRELGRHQLNARSWRQAFPIR